MTLLFNWLVGQKTHQFDLTEKLAAVLIFFICCFVFNVTNIDIDNSAQMLMEELSSNAASNASGKMYNKLYWSFLFILSVGVVCLNKTPFLANAYRIKPMVYICAFMLVSLLWSDYPSITARRSILSIFVIFSVFIGVVYSRNREALIHVIYRVAVIALMFNFAVLVVGLGFSSGLGFSGIHSHKNVAGLVASISIWVVICNKVSSENKTHIWSAVAFVFGWLIILLLSKSKTSIALVVLSPVIWFSLFYSAKLFKINILIVSAMLGILLMLPISILQLLLGQSIVELMSNVGGDVTLTGRDFIWKFVWEYISENPVLGVGYGAFWDVGESASNIGNHGHGKLYLNFLHQAHNGYLDILLVFGFFGFFLVLKVIASIWANIDKAINKGSKLAHLSAILLVFILIHNVTESSLLRTTHINWVLVLITYFIFTTIERKRKANGKH